MDELVEDFRKDNLSRMETLYQILTTLHDTGLEEPDRQATIEEYTLYVDIIASKHKNAEQRGLETGDGQGHTEERGESIIQGENEGSTHPRRSREEEAERILWQIRKGLLHKRH